MKKIVGLIGSVVALLVLPTIPVLVIGSLAWIGRRFWIDRQRKFS